jgi:hypothetical protein
VPTLLTTLLLHTAHSNPGLGKSQQSWHRKGQQLIAATEIDHDMLTNRAADVAHAVDQHAALAA